MRRLPLILLVGPALLAGAAGCGPSGPPAAAPVDKVAGTAPAASASALAVYLADAELQAETPAQLRVLRAALSDLRSAPGSPRRYPGLDGTPDARDAAAVLRHHFVPARPLPLAAGDLAADDAASRAALDAALARVDAALSPSR